MGKIEHFARTIMDLLVGFGAMLFGATSSYIEWWDRRGASDLTIILVTVGVVATLYGSLWLFAPLLVFKIVSLVFMFAFLGLAACLIRIVADCWHLITAGGSSKSN